MGESRCNVEPGPVLFQILEAVASRRWEQAASLLTTSGYSLPQYHRSQRVITAFCHLQVDCIMTTLRTSNRETVRKLAASLRNNHCRAESYTISYMDRCQQFWNHQSSTRRTSGEVPIPLGRSKHTPLRLSTRSRPEA